MSDKIDISNVTKCNNGIDLVDIMSSTAGYKDIPESATVVEDEKKNPLFQIIDALFKNRTYIYNITEQQASQNLFMVLRRMAINYPLQSNVFNNGKVNALDVIKFWSDYLYCGRTPKWVYTSVKKQKEKKKSDITSKDIEEYINYNNIDKKDFLFALKIYNEEAVKDVLDFKQTMKSLKENVKEENIDN